MASPAYITVAEFYDAYDRRLIEELGTDIGGAGGMTSSNERIYTAIERASEDVQMAATVGNRYSTDELDDLVTADRWAIKGLVADLAIAHLVSRRMSDIPEAIREKVRDAKETLAALRDGDAVFPIEAKRTAGKPKISIIGESQRANLNLVADTEFFPGRNTKEA
jgi:hypothetical protein